MSEELVPLTRPQRAQAEGGPIDVVVGVVRFAAGV